MPRAYRPSPNELERLLREEKEKRKRERVMQVRAMSRKQSTRIRNSYKSELNRQINKVVADCRIELLEDKENKMRSMREEYDKSLQQRGKGHDLAKEWTDPQWAKMAAQEEAEVRAKERFLLALDEKRERFAEAEAEATAAIRARQAALQVERERAKFLASLPPPSPPPYEAAIHGRQGRPVIVCDRHAMNTTHIHTVPDHYAVEAVEPWSSAAREPDARAKAVVEEERLAALRQRSVVSLEENVVKAHMRGKEAIRRELVHQDYTNLISELTGLARADLARRQRDFQRLPSRLFAVPHRAGHEARTDERQRERGFEAAFAEQLTRGRPSGEGDSEEEGGGGEPRPKPTFQPESPTKVRSRRRAPQKDRGREGDTDNLRFVGVPDAPRRSSEAALPPKSSVRIQPNSKEETLQRLYQRIRSQRDKWLEIPEAEMSGKMQKAFPDRLVGYAPFASISSGEEVEEEEEQEEEVEEEDEEVRSSIDSQEKKRAPGQRPPMLDLVAISRLRCETAGKIRGLEKARDAETGSGDPASDRARLDAEMLQLDRRMEALKKTGQRRADPETEKDLKTYTIEKDADLARLVQHTSSSPEREASESGRSEFSGSSLADVRAYQQHALARFASLTAAESSDRDEISSAASKPPSVRTAAQSIEARLHKVELDLENERRRQAMLRQYLKQRAAEGDIVEEEEEPVVLPRCSEASVPRVSPYRPLTSDFDCPSSAVSSGDYPDPYPFSAASNPFSELLHESPPVRLPRSTPPAFSSSTTDPPRMLADFFPNSVGSKFDARNPFLSSIEPSRTTPRMSVDHHPLLSSFPSGSALTNPFLSRISNEVHGPTPETLADSRNPFRSHSSTEAPRQGSDVARDSRNPFLSTTSLEIKRPTSELATVDTAVTPFDAQSTPKKVFMDSERQMTLDQMAGSMTAKTINSDVSSPDWPSSGERVPDVLVHPDELSFDTLPSNAASVTTEEKKDQGDAPALFPDTPDSLALPSAPAELVLPFPAVPLRLRPRPPAVLDPQNELSRITEVDTPVSLSGATVDETEPTESPSEPLRSRQGLQQSLQELEKLQEAQELQCASEALDEAANSRAAFLRDFLVLHRNQLEPEEAQEELSASEPNSLSQLTATGSDLSSTHGRSFKVLPTLEPPIGEHPCCSSTLTEESFPEPEKQSEQATNSGPVLTNLTQLTITETTTSAPTKSNLTQLSVSEAAISAPAKPNLTQRTASTLSSAAVRSLTQHPTTHFESCEQLAPSPSSPTQVPTANLTQRTASTLSSAGVRSLTQHPTTHFESCEQLATSPSSLTQAPTANLTSGVGTTELSSEANCRALTQVTTAIDSAGAVTSLEQDPADHGVTDDPCSLTQYPVSFMDISRPLSQFHDLEDSKEDTKGGHLYEDTLQALDFSLPTSEVAPSKSGAPSQVAAMALPVLNETTSPGSLTTSSVVAPNIDGLIARSRQLRQDNNSSLLRDDLLGGGPTDWSLGSSSVPEGMPEAQEETKLPKETTPAPNSLQMTVDSDSLVSFLRHEQDLCRDSLSCRGSSESGSLQAAYAARRKEQQETEGKRRIAGSAKEKSSSLEEMQKTLASWKAERLQRNVSAKVLTRVPVSRSPPSSSASSDSVAASGKAKDECARTLRLWRQLEEVKAREREEQVRRERERNRAKGRAFSERMRAERLAKSKKPGKPL